MSTTFRKHSWGITPGLETQSATTGNIQETMRESYWIKYWPIRRRARTLWKKGETLAQEIGQCSCQLASIDLCYKRALTHARKTEHNRNEGSVLSLTTDVLAAVLAFVHRLAFDQTLHLIYFWWLLASLTATEEFCLEFRSLSRCQAARSLRLSYERRPHACS